MPSRKGADLIIEAINTGTLPPPMRAKGWRAADRANICDEAAEPVSEYRNLVQRQEPKRLSVMHPPARVLVWPCC